MWLGMTVLDKGKKWGKRLERLNATRTWLVECPSKEFRIYAAGTGKPFNSMELGSDMLFKQIILLAGLLDSKASPTPLPRRDAAVCRERERLSLRRGREEERPREPEPGFNPRPATYRPEAVE